MRKLKVYLQYPWKYPDSPYYKYLIESSPENVEYLNAKEQKGVIVDKKKFWFSNWLKRSARLLLNTLGVSVQNAHLTITKEAYDVIHCAHCLSLNKNKPWVADFEAVWQMFVGEKTGMGIRQVRKTLANRNCKKIIAWTEETKGMITKQFPEIKDKIEVVYPAVPVRNTKINKSKKITVTFSGRYFYWKGGLHALEVIDRLTKKHKNVYGIINSEVPQAVKEKYSQNKKIEFHGLVSQKELFELYKRSNILIYPGYSDTLGFAYLEAMSFGLPIITFNGESRKEIVTEGKTGFVLDYFANIKSPYDVKKEVIGRNEEEIIKGFVKKAELLIKNKNLREKMAKNCINEIKSGKFSIKERNKRLSKIYSEALA